MLSGISYWSMPGGLDGTCSIEQALHAAKLHRFDSLELCIGTDGVVNVALTEAECRRIRQQIDESGVTVQTLASGMSWGFNPVSNDPHVRRHAQELNEAALQRAAWLGCEAYLYVPGVVVSPIAPKERVRYDHAIERARENVRGLLNVAERVKVDLCLENVWNGLFYSPIEFANFVDSFQHERLGIYLDAGNLLGYQQHPPHWVEILGNRIKRVHVKGYRETFGFAGTYEFCKLGEGDVPLAETVESLRSIQYDSTVVAEMLPAQEGLLESTAKTLNSLLQAT